jgi:hypothetical protein
MILQDVQCVTTCSLAKNRALKAVQEFERELWGESVRPSIAIPFFIDSILSTVIFAISFLLFLLVWYYKSYDYIRFIIIIAIIIFIFIILIIIILFKKTSNFSCLFSLSLSLSLSLLLITRHIECTAQKARTCLTMEEELATLRPFSDIFPSKGHFKFALLEACSAAYFIWL